MKMHPFPKDPIRRKVWAQKMKRAKWMPSNGSVLCGNHFTKDQYRFNGKRLKPDAVPTIFGHTSEIKVKRKAPTNRNIASERQDRIRRAFSLDHNYFKPNERHPNTIKGLTEREESSNDDSPHHEETNGIFEDVDVIIHGSGELDSIPHEYHLQFLRNVQLEWEIQEKRAKIDSLYQEIEFISTELSDLRKPEKTHGFLTEDQAAFLQRKSMKGYNWSEETMKRALELRIAGGMSGYEALLRQGYPLPSVRTLQKYTQKNKRDSSLEPS